MFKQASNVISKFMNRSKVAPIVNQPEPDPNQRYNELVEQYKTDQRLKLEQTRNREEKANDDELREGRFAEEYDARYDSDSPQNTPPRMKLKTKRQTLPTIAEIPQPTFRRERLSPDAIALLMKNPLATSR